MHTNTHTSCAGEHRAPKRLTHTHLSSRRMHTLKRKTVDMAGFMRNFGKCLFVKRARNMNRGNEQSLTLEYCVFRVPLLALDARPHVGVRRQRWHGHMIKALARPFTPVAHSNYTHAYACRCRRLSDVRAQCALIARVDCSQFITHALCCSLQCSHPRASRQCAGVHQ